MEEAGLRSALVTRSKPVAWQGQVSDCPYCAEGERYVMRRFSQAEQQFCDQEVNRQPAGIDQRRDQRR